jgi:hypothetical protein
MITAKNLKQVLNLIDGVDLCDAWHSNDDYIGLWVNGYGSVFIESLDTCDDLDERVQDIQSTGGFVCDKETFAGFFDDFDLHLGDKCILRVLSVKYGDPSKNEDTEYYLNDGSIFYDRRWGTCGYHYNGRDEDYWDVFEIVKTFMIKEGTWKEV